MTTITPRLSIGEVSERTGLTTHTLRFYEQESLLVDPVERDSAGRRLFTEQDVEWLRVCTKLRSSGMPLPDIRHYVDLFRAGPATVQARFDLLRAHQDRVRAQVADLQSALAVIDHKVDYYAARMAAGTADNLWRNGPECD
jgi:DNA-binding transcriptional MerR regulator